MFVSRTAGRHASPRTTSRFISYSKFGGIAAASLALVAGVVTQASPASANTKTVTLTIEGVTNSVSTNADSVSELLTEESVPYDTTDLVSPGLKSDVVDGMAVSWTPATRILVKRDRNVRTYHVVGATVRDVRDELGLPTQPSAKYSKYETRRYKITRFFSPSGRALTLRDTVRDDATAVVHNIRVAFPKGHQRIERRVVTDRTKLVRSGARRVYKNGHDGRRAVVYRAYFVDGEFQTRKVVAAKVVRRPQRKVVKIGTGPNWTGLARCESGGNPNAVNPAGYYGLYQFSLSTWRAVGGRGYPTDYGYWEQTKRAWKLYRSSGSSPWPVCGAYL
jgi:uncharacterized protein YabE (DUF348 family)